MRSRIVVCPAILLLCLGLSFGTVGCSKKSEGTVAANVGAILTDAEVKQFAVQLEKAASSGNATAISDVIDADALGDTALAGIGFSSAFKNDFIGGMRQGMAKDGGFGKQITDATAKGGTFRLLRTVTVDGKQRVRFRLMMPELGGVNYMDFVLARRKGGAIKAVDVYIFTSGEMISATMHRMMLPMAEKQGLLARLRQEDKGYIEATKAFGEMAAALRQGNAKEVVRRYNALPEVMKKEKMAQIVRLQAASAGDEGEYQQALERFQKDFAGDPAADMMGIDYYFLRKNYNKALEMVDRLDKAIGGDPALNLIRAGTLGEAGRTQEVIPLLQKTIKEMPDDVFAHYMLLGMYLQEKIYEPVPELMKKLAALGEKMEDPKDVQEPMWKAFVKSPQYQKWKQSNKSP